ncbi:MAG: hypothetical protein K5883_02820 [Pseudobutyrivibrio sp.]|nr:hypothetical protein [Pseudobutyrivibrio sp.]
MSDEQFVNWQGALTVEVEHETVTQQTTQTFEAQAISDLIKDTNYAGIEDEKVAKARINIDGDAGKKGFMCGLLVLVATKLGYDKYKEDTNPNK